MKNLARHQFNLVKGGFLFWEGNKRIFNFVLTATVMCFIAFIKNIAGETRNTIAIVKPL